MNTASVSLLVAAMAALSCTLAFAVALPAKETEIKDHMKIALAEYGIKEQIPETDPHTGFVVGGEELDGTDPGSDRDQR